MARLRRGFPPTPEDPAQQSGVAAYQETLYTETHLEWQLRHWLVVGVPGLTSKTVEAAIKEVNSIQPKTEFKFGMDFQESRANEEACAREIDAFPKALVEKAPIFSRMLAGLSMSNEKELLGTLAPKEYVGGKERFVAEFRRHQEEKRMAAPSLTEKQKKAAHGGPYVPPSREGKRAVAAFLPEETLAEIKILAAIQHRTTQSLMEEALEDLFEKHAEDVSAARKALRSPEIK